MNKTHICTVLSLDFCWMCFLHEVRRRCCQSPPLLVNAFKLECIIHFEILNELRKLLIHYIYLYSIFLATVLTRKRHCPCMLVQMITQYCLCSELFVTVFTLIRKTVLVDHFVKFDRVGIVLYLGSAIWAHPFRFLNFRSFQTSTYNSFTKNFLRLDSP